MAEEDKRPLRHFSDDFKRRIVRAVNERTGSIADIARSHDLTTGMLSRWRHDPRFNDRLAGQTFLPVAVETGGPAPASAPAPSAPPSAVPIEIELNCGSRVRCWGAVSEDALYRVISVLRRAA